MSSGALKSNVHRALFGYMLSLYPGDTMIPVDSVNSTVLLPPHAATTDPVFKTIYTRTNHLVDSMTIRAFSNDTAAATM